MRQRQLFILAAGVCGLCLNLFVVLPGGSAVRQENEAAYEEMIRIRRERGDDVWARNGALEDGFPLNAALVSGQGSLSGYFPTSDSGFGQTMEELGYLVPWVATQDVGGTEISGGLLRMALVFDEALEKLALEGGTPLERQAELSELTAGRSLLELFDGTELEQGDEGELLLLVEGDRTIWLDAGKTASEIRISVNGKPVEIPESASGYSPHRLICLGDFENREIALRVTDSSGISVSPESLQIGLMDRTLWRETMGALRNAGEKKLEDMTRAVPGQSVFVDSAAGTIRVELSEVPAGQTLFLPFAALEGWRCERNGEDIAVRSVLGGFLGAALAEGENLLVFSFRPPWIEAGLACTVSGMALLACLAGISRRKTKAVSLLLRSAGRLYEALWAAGLAGIYALPAAGLLCYSAGKLLSLW